MEIFEVIGIIVVSIVVPYIVALIRNETIKGNTARWIAIGVSVIAGLCVGLLDGLPTTPEAIATCVFASISGVQVAYSAFRSIGITSGWLDALMEIKAEVK